MNKGEILTCEKGLVTNSGPAFPLVPSGLLLEVVDLEDLKREVSMT